MDAGWSSAFRNAFAPYGPLSRRIAKRPRRGPAEKARSSRTVEGIACTIPSERLQRCNLDCVENSSISHFTTFMMMVVTVTIFIVCALRIQSVFERLSVYGQGYPFARDQRAIAKMLSVLALLSLNLMLVGRFTGFSLLLAFSILASLHALSGPRLRTY